MQRRYWLGLLALVCVLALPSSVMAQSSITGQVKDESGGVLPGVTIEAASPALIEKAKSAVSDDQGRFQIIDLRQGTYKVTFTLPGFSTVVRDGIELPANFTATVSADMKVGALEETITVSGQTPLVDVSQAARTQVITRDIIDSLPTTRNIMSVGNMIPGIRLGTPDIGGSRAMEQTNPRGHGLNNTHTVQQVDGMSVNSQETSNQQSYYNDALSAEVAVTTAAQTAENQSGGMRVNAIPKDGGNIVSGSVFIGGSDGNWQSDNIDDYLKSQNITSGNGIVHIQNFNASVGGPVKKDKIWFFASVRHISTDETVANTPLFLTAPNGDNIRSILDQYIRDGLARLTWQVNQKTKVAAFMQRTWKRKGKDFGFGTDPRAGTQRDPSKAHYAIGNAKYTNTLTSKILLEAGYSTAYQHWTGFNQPAVRLDRYLADGVTVNPAWLANGRITDTASNINPRCAYAAGCLAWVSNGQDQRTADIRRVVVASMSYVTGTHNIKFGFQNSFGPVHVYTDRQADLVQNYVNNRPQTVTVYTTPSNRFSHVDYDLGYYIQDSWTIKRLTLSPGVRVDNFSSRIESTAMPAGRFVGERFFAERKNVPTWNNDIAPRFSAAYDLFGDGRTAVKAGWSKYYEPLTGGFADTYAPGVANENRNWFDCAINTAGTACSGVALPTNNDGIAQNNEIGPGSATFGLAAERDFDPEVQRQSNVEIMASVSHQLTSRVSATVGYYHRTFDHVRATDRTLVDASQYSAFTAPAPALTSPSLAGGIDDTLSGIITPGSPITMYAYNRTNAFFNSSPQLDRNVDYESIYNGVDVSVQGRLPGGSTVIASWTMEKNISVFCANDDNPNGTATNDLYTATSVTAGGPYCDHRNFDV
ncbi:MAG: TonB-dependent receptor, partial [Vicinamibacterales bacterium]|nr:TonB-dependent receptor [Vicinamibacterales bacterium]